MATTRRLTWVPDYQIEEEPPRVLLAASSQPADRAPSAQQVPAASAAQPATGAPTVQPRPISSELRSLFDALQARINQAPITAEDIMRSREYQEMASALDFQAGQAQAAQRRDLASRGVLRSTPAVQSFAATDAYYTAQKQALIPQLIQQAYARRQQDIANALSLFNALANLENQAFQQGLQQFQAETPYSYLTAAEREQVRQWEEGWQRELPFREAAITGRYLPQGAREAIDEIIAAKEAWERATTDAERAAAHARANQARARLQSYGIDPSLFGADVTTAQARANISQAGILTPDQRQMLASMFGIDPVTGQQTIAGRQADIQQRLSELEAQRAQLLAEIEADPNVGLRAQRQRELERLDAEIAATRALVAQRQTQIEATRAQLAGAQSEAAEKARQQAVRELEVYDVTPTARNVWLDLKAEYDNILAQTGTIDRERAAQLMRTALLAPGLTSKDKSWIAAMHASYFGDAGAGGTLYQYLKGYKPPQADPLQELLRQ